MISFVYVLEARAYIDGLAHIFGPCIKVQHVFLHSVCCCTVFALICVNAYRRQSSRQLWTCAHMVCQHQPRPPRYATVTFTSRNKAQEAAQKAVFHKKLHFAR